jgi:hypothetical protein
MKICPKFALVAAGVELADPGFRLGTSRKILTRQQNRCSLLVRGEQHQSREIDQPAGRRAASGRAGHRRLL